jgi:hypothetical protein
MLKIIQLIFKPFSKPVECSCVAAQADMDAKVAALLPKDLQSMTLDQWRTFVKEVMEPVDQPQTVTYPLEDGTMLVIGNVVPPLTLVGDYSSTAGYVEFKDKLGTLRRVEVQKPNLSIDS